jgi:hypothetical protein
VQLRGYKTGTNIVRQGILTKEIANQACPVGSLISYWGGRSPVKKPCFYSGFFGRIEEYETCKNYFISRHYNYPDIWGMDILIEL